MQTKNESPLNPYLEKVQPVEDKRPRAIEQDFGIDTGSGGEMFRRYNEGDDVHTIREQDLGY